jgi:hypothetical protein
MQNKIDDLIEAVKTIADTGFDATRIAKRPSLSAKKGFYRPGERPDDGAPFTPTTTIPKYGGPPSGRSPSNEEKRGAWQLQEEYLAGRLGKNEEENGRLWNTVKWINRHHVVTKTLAEALPPLNMCVADKLSQSTEGTGSLTGPDDEAPDEAENEGIELESINVCQADKSGNTKVMGEAETTYRLDIKTDGHDLLRLIDALEEIDKPAKDVDVPLLPQTAFPSSDQRAESGKIIRMLILGMRSLWHPVIRAIADHASMKPLGKTQNVGDSVAAAVGRTRVIEGLRLAESIRKGLARSERRDEVITKEVLGKPLPMPVRPPEGHYWNQAAGPVIKLSDAANDTA